MKLTSHLPQDKRKHSGRGPVAPRPHRLADHSGRAARHRPVCILLRDDETILLYSRPEKGKLRNIAANPKVSFALDVTDMAPSMCAWRALPGGPTTSRPRTDAPSSCVKYTDALGAMLRTPEQFATLFSATAHHHGQQLHT